MSRSILIATKNRHKVLEANIALKQFNISATPVDVEKREIQSDNLVDIAVYAAKTAYQIVKKPIVVEDAGLFIDSLNGFPGPYSSYVFKTIGINGILKLLEGVHNRRARFVSVVALAIDIDDVVVFIGEVSGTISMEPRGSGGFGFDPIFIPYGYTKTFAEMSIEEKTAISHRGKAFKQLGEWLAKNWNRVFKD